MVTGAGHWSHGERTSKLSPAAWLYVAAVVAAAVAVLAKALGADPDLDGPVSQSWTVAVLVLLFLICDSTPTAVESRQSAWSPSSSVTLAAVVLVGPVGALVVGARAPEVGGYVEDGHARRVGRLAVLTGRELGMSEPQLLELEYAALMHDIGQLSLRDPIPGGATVLAAPEQQRRIAELGAGIIDQAGVLDGVAEIVRYQSWPWRGQEREPPVGSRIIRAANAFDDLVGASTETSRTMAALEWLRLDTATEYDQVVEALARIAYRRYRSRW